MSSIAGMTSRLFVPLLALLAAAGCAAPPEPAAAREPARAPATAAPIAFRATIEPSGYATITEAPPALFTPVPPGQPQPLTPEQIAGHQRFARAGAFQNDVREEVQALDARLRREQTGNYVSLYYDNDSDPPRAVFQFLRNGPATLARYTRHPQFVGTNVRFSEAELQAASEFMWRIFGPDRVIQSTGIGRNSVTVRVSVTEEEFRALMARKGVTVPESVELEFAAAGPAAIVNAALPRQIAPLVRIFQRDDRPAGMLEDIYSRARLELRDGCFRIPDRDNALALFPLGTRLFVDGEGYLAFGSEAPGYGRVGEMLIFPGVIREVTAPELVAPIHAACGPGPVVKINGTASEAAHRAQAAVSENANAVRHLQEAYGLSEAGARRAAQRCAEMAGGGVCLTTPPPPVMRQADCPQATRLSFGLCRTPEGYIRPLPRWLEEFAGN
jgi:hypothetical protein